MAEEGMKKTENELIFIGRPLEFDEDEFLQSLNNLMNAAYSNKPNIRELVGQIVPTYHPEKIGSKDEHYQALAEKSK